MEGTLLLDSVTVVESEGILHADSIKTKAEITLTAGGAAEVVVESGIILQKGTIELNDNRLVLQNSDVTALQFTDGTITAADPDWGKVVWHIAEDSGLYVVPFHSEALEPTWMGMIITTRGDGIDGFVEFSTYQTDAEVSPNNLPYPAEVLAPGYDGAEATLDTFWADIADRYWYTRADDYTTVPVAQVAFMYAEENLEGDNTITKANLAISYLGEDCWESMSAEIDTSENLAISDPMNDYYIWILHDNDVGPCIPSLKASAAELIPVKEKSSDYKLLPTLVTNNTDGRVALNKDETGELQIFNLHGSLTKVFRLTEGSNTIPLGKHLQQDGVYLYRVWVDGKLKNTDRLVRLE